VSRDGTAEPALCTLLLLDLVDSTALVDRLGEKRGAELMRRHDRLARDLIRRHRGREIDKTDGFLVLFERPIQACAFALEYQRRLAELARGEDAALAARIGIHVGEAVIWENPPEEVARGAKPVEVEGLVKPAAARLMALALPGQILLSGMAYAIARRGLGELAEGAARVEFRHHGRYRLKGVSEPMAVFEIGEPGLAPLRPPKTMAKAKRLRPWWRRGPVLAVGLLVVVIAAVLGYLLLRSEPGIAFAAREWVVVGDLVNRTGETLLDESLDLAFREGLAQSRHINVLGRLQVRDALQRMRRDPLATPIDRATGIELALREQARALLLPSIERSGDGFELAVEVVDPASANTVLHLAEKAARPEELLPALDELIDELRSRLGESVQSVASDRVPLQKATTSNLEALRIYSVGRLQYEQLKYDEARRMYQRAIELDPEFAMAYAGIAATYIPLGLISEGLPPARRAVELKQRLTRREALYAEALLASAEDPETGVGLWRDYAALYPDYGAGQNNAAVLLWFDLNRCAEAIPLFHEAFVSRDPHARYAGHFKGYCQLWTGDAAAAAASFREAVAGGGLWMTFGLVDTLAFAEVDPAEVEAVLATEVGSLPAQFAQEKAMRRVTWLAWRGRLSEARAAADSALESARAAKLNGSAARAEIYRAAIDLHDGARLDRLSELLAPRAALLAEAPYRYYDAGIQIATLALIAERSGQADLAAEALALLRAHPLPRKSLPVEALQRAIAQWRSAASTAEEASAGIPEDSDYDTFVQVRVARAQALERSADRAAASRAWLSIDQLRSRAFAEYNDVFTLQVLNVLDANLALARAAQWSTDPDQAAQLRARLDRRLVDADPAYRHRLGLDQATDSGPSAAVSPP
jgi:putative peptide modification system cyclase